MVGLTGYGLYVPEDTVTGEEIARKSGIPEDVVVEKMGVHEKHVCPPDGDHVTDMCVKAAERALSHAGIEASDLDAVLYHGSEFKNFVVWSAAANVADQVDRILLVSASREEDLVNYENEGSSFMFNFGSGACAMVLEEAPDPPSRRFGRAPR